jgi:hypothetical protein
MTIRHVLVLYSAFVLSLGYVGLAEAQGGKKPKPPASWPGTATFRCNGLTTSDCGDSIVGDSSFYEGLGAPEGGEGAHLRDSSSWGREMWIGVKNGLRLYINFGEQDQDAPCHAGAYCQFGSSFPNNDILIGERYGEIQTNVIDQSGMGDLTRSLLDIPSGETWQARVHIAFYDASGRLWNLNFWNQFPSEGGHASIKRLAACTWEITDGDSKAELSTLVRVSGKQFRSYEGFYPAKFLITFEAPGCPAP